MRFIDLAYLEPPPEFEANRNAALEAGDGNVDAHSDVWRCCKGALKDASFGKCYYCEMRDARSDGAVDHYRPKSRYNWAAYRFRNFRFACTFCNSRRTDKATGKTGGKGNDFPLSDENARATCEAEEFNESPLLLDPCKAADPIAIDFQSDGNAVPNFGDEYDVRRQRADTSIRVYHLNHSELSEARRRLAVELFEKIDTAERAMANCATGDKAAEESFDNAVRDLRRAIKPEAELSVFAKRVLQSQRGNTVVDGILGTG